MTGGVTFNHGGDMLLLATLLFACGEKTEDSGDISDTGDTAQIVVIDEVAAKA